MRNWANLLILGVAGLAMAALLLGLGWYLAAGIDAAPLWTLARLAGVVSR